MDELTEASQLIVDKIQSAATARVTKHRKTLTAPLKFSGHFDQNSLIAMGASTGGTEALREVLTQLPAEIPPVLIVQHIPAGFSNAFARRLNELCPFEVMEAYDRAEITKNRVLIAPGGQQMRPVWRHGKGHVLIEDAPPVNRHKPSVDFMFNALAEFEFRQAVGVILTGMGGDGAAGLLKLKEKGWMTIAQNKESCVVFGMPAVAIDLGAAQHICSLHDIPQKILQLLPSKKTA
jgi:two-component system chemotaxis response regulator CheB